PGMANKVLGPLAHRVYLAFASAAGSFARSKVRVVGTPIRRAFLDRIPVVTADAAGERRQTLLIFGGSQGAHAINSAMIEALPHLAAMRTGLAVIHQTGEAELGRVKAAYEAARFRAEVVPFLFDMPKALRSADLVVSRSGAMTVAELAICGKGAILIPLPQAIYNHQALNAGVMESAGAAVVLPQAELTGLKLAKTIEMLLHDPDRLRVMGERSRTLGRADSAEAIVEECLALVRC
ncbi:MAG TPA: glycosyltransferase, partial [Nitrospiraceae bacterium]|nr:glycosyltransferase [Nitrospiraceae bacterium]